MPNSLWDTLNAEQGRLWLAGQQDTPQYKALLHRMSAVWPKSGYGPPPDATLNSAVAGLQQPPWAAYGGYVDPNDPMGANGVSTDWTLSPHNKRGQ